MIFKQLQTNVKGEEITLSLPNLLGVKGTPRSGKSRIAQAITLAVAGALPRLGRKQDILELVGKESLPNGQMISKLWGPGKPEFKAEYVAELAQGKVTEVEHTLSHANLTGSLIAQDHLYVLETGPDLTMKALYEHFCDPLPVANVRGLDKKQMALLEIEMEKGGGDAMQDRTIIDNLESKMGAIKKKIGLKDKELDSLELAEAKAGARSVECPTCGIMIDIPSPGREEATLQKNKLEQEYKVYEGVISELYRLMREEVISKQGHIQSLVESFMPSLGIKSHLHITKTICQWGVIGTDGRPHGAKVACGTEKSALTYGLIRAMGHQRKRMGLPVILLLDDPHFVGLTISDRRKMLQDVAFDHDKGELDQVVVISAEDIFPEDYTVVTVE